MSIEFPPTINVSCDGDHCDEVLEVDILWYSNNTTPWEEVSDAMEAGGWQYIDDYFGHCYCPRCKRLSGEAYLSEEYCSNCGDTVEIMSDKVVPCPECGASVIPCNSCHYSESLHPLYDRSWESRCGTKRCPFHTGIAVYQDRKKGGP
jgi:predicted RNA-binding Zn-ribbon protein involved in translation (DUF1610 family)